MKVLREVLIDLSGTLHVEDHVIPGAKEALGRLRKRNLIIKFITNTKEKKKTLHTRLTMLGFKLKPDEIYTSFAAAQKLIVKKHLKPMFILSPDVMEDFEDLACPSNETPNTVVIGLAPTEYTYEKFNTAFKYLMNGAKLIAIHADKYYKCSDGLTLGPGCFVKGLEYAAECKAKVVGKPKTSFFKSALDDDITPEEAIVIGDDVIDDIQGAMKAGMRGILVQTGIYQPGDETKIDPSPTAVVHSFVEAVDMILNEIQ